MFSPVCHLAQPLRSYSNRVDELTQAKYLARIWLTSTLIGSPATIYYGERCRLYVTVS